MAHKRKRRNFDEMTPRVHEEEGDEGDSAIDQTTTTGPAVRWQIINSLKGEQRSRGFSRVLSLVVLSVRRIARVISFQITRCCIRRSPRLAELQPRPDGRFLNISTIVAKTSPPLYAKMAGAVTWSISAISWCNLMKRVVSCIRARFARQSSTIEDSADCLSHNMLANDG